MDGEANAAAHGDAIEIGNVGFRVGGDKVVEFVLKTKVGFGGCAASVAIFRDVAGEMGDVTAGAEGFGASAADDDYGCEGGFLVFL